MSAGHPDTVARDALHATLRHWQRRLAAVWWSRLALRGGAAGALVAAVWAVAERWGVEGERMGAPAPGWWVAAGMGAAVAWGARTWRRIALTDAALWMETGVLPWRRHDPSPTTRAALEGASYALVTCAERAEAQDAEEQAGGAGRRALLQQAAALAVGVPAWERLRRQALTTLAVPATVLLAATMLALALRPNGGADGASGQGPTGPHGTPGGSAAAAAAPLGSWRVTVRPPAYTALPERMLGDTGALAALAGSVVEVRGAGAPPAVTERRAAGDTTRRAPPAVLAQGSAWLVRLVAADAPTAFTMARGGRRRLLLVEGVGDSLPVVTLRQPARDSVLAAPQGTLPLQAEVHDDLGVRTAHFELVVTSGEGERFTATTRRVAPVSGAGRRGMAMRGRLALDSLGLRPGDVVHVRAVARDAHPMASRELGVSETRRYRIARRGERDSLAVEGAAPPGVDTSALSQRMLLQLASALARQRARLPRATLREESGRLARDQGRLRQAVGAVVFQRLSGESEAEHTHYAGDGHEHGVEMAGDKLALAEGNDGPVVAVNRPLLEAYNHMWDAGRALEQADPAAALPPMRLALAAIERARAAERLYLRGRPPTVVVDLARVRMAGRDTGRTAARGARGALPVTTPLRVVRLLAAARVAGADAAAARDSVALLRLEALADAPAWGAALAEVQRLLGAGAPAAQVTEAFVRARRVLGGVARLPGGAGGGPAARWSRGAPP